MLPDGRNQMTQANAEFVAAAAWQLAGSNRVWRASLRFCTISPPGFFHSCRMPHPAAFA
jgi:hypothetical protein